jgi:hypothetical protein
MFLGLMNEWGTTWGQHRACKLVTYRSGAVKKDQARRSNYEKNFYRWPD